MNKAISDRISKLMDGAQAIRLILDSVNVDDTIDTDAYLYALRCTANVMSKELCELEDTIAKTT